MFEENNPIRHPALEITLIIEGKVLLDSADILDDLLENNLGRVNTPLLIVTPHPLPFENINNEFSEQFFNPPKTANPGRIIKKSPERFFNGPKTSDLWNVGIKKALGYLPNVTLQEYGYNVNEIETALNTKNMQAMTIGNFLYAYHYESLKKLLTDNEQLLKLHSWPTEPAQFAVKVEEVTAEDPMLRDLIHRAFTDPTCVITPSTCGLRR